MFCALQASAVIRGEHGDADRRDAGVLPGPYRTAVAPAEILVELRVPLWAAGSAYVKVDRRAGDWAVAASAAVVQTASAGVIAAAGIGLAAVGPFIAAEAEDAWWAARRPGDLRRGRPPGRHRARPAADQRGPWTTSATSQAS